MTKQSELDTRIKELELLTKKQADQIEGLKQSVNILIGMIAASFDDDEEHNSPMGPQMPNELHGPALNN